MTGVKRSAFVAALILGAVSAYAQNIIVTSAGTGFAGYSGDGGMAVLAALNIPQGLAFDSSGNLYVADSSNNRVRKIGTSGIITTVAGGGVNSGNGGPAIQAQLNGPRGLAIDASGNLYISEVYGQRIRKVDSSGIITTYAGIGTPGFSGDGGPATAAMLTSPMSIAVGPGGALFVADFGNNRIRKIDSAGIITTVAGTGVNSFSGDGGPAADATFSNPTGIAFDAAGLLYIVDSYNNRIRRIDSGGNIATVAGGGNCCTPGDGGPATSAYLHFPTAVVFDSSGNLYIADTNNGRIRMVSAGGTIATVAGTGVAGFSGDGGLAANALVNGPTYLAIDVAGNLYVADSGNHRIRKILPPPSSNPVPTLSFTVPSGAGVGGPSLTLTVYGANFVPGATVRWNVTDRVTTFVNASQLNAAIPASDLTSAGPVTITVFNPLLGGGGGSSGAVTLTVYTLVAPTALITTFAGNGFAGYSGDGGAALLATFYRPQGLALDGAGNLFVADSQNNRVRKISAAGVVSTIAGTGASGYFGNGVAATAAQLYNPTGLALDGTGNLFIADTSNHAVRKVAPNGTITTVAGTGTSSGFSGDGGPGTNAKLYRPTGLAFDAAGNMYIADQGNNRIRKLAVDGTISTVAGSSSAGFLGDGGSATSSSLSSPTDVKLDAAGNLYISDTYNGRIRKVGLDGAISTVAGNGACCSSSTGDGGPATAAILSYPQGIALDAAGNLYISEGYSLSRIRMVYPGGVITTVAGTGASGFSGDGGPAINATLSSSYGVWGFLAVDAAGNLYIADTDNERIRRLQAPSSNNPVPTLTSLVPSAAQVGGSPFVLTAYGSNFVPGSTVRWSGADLVTTFVSSSQLTAAIPASDLSSAGTVSVTVFNPTLGGGGGLSPSLNFTVYAPVPPTAIITTVAGTGFAGYSGDGSAALLTSFNYPSGLTFDGTGNLYVADTRNNRVRKISAAGVVTTVAGTGSSGFSGDGGAPTLAQLSNPSGLARDGAGNLFIADTGNYRVRRVAPNGTITTVAGNGTFGFSGDGGPGTSANLSSPNGLAVDAAGNLYIADKNNHRIRKVSAADGTITTVAGNGSYGFLGDGAPAISSPLYLPSDVKLDAAGNLFISDTGNNRIRQVSTDGTIRTVAGTTNCCSTSTGDGGPAISATIYNPNGIALDAAGNLYISEGYYSSRIRRVNPAGIINTVAGNGNTGFLGDGGLAINATFASYYSTAMFLAVDASGSLYITDSGNNRIRKLQEPATSNPIPTLGTLVPSVAEVGGPASTLTVYGNNFAPGATVRWNGADRATTFVNAIQLTAAIPASDLSSAGTVAVTVFNPTLSGGGGPSNSLNFTVASPAPLPASVIFTIAGSGFSGYSGDGPALYASFNNPLGLVFDGTGNLYVADSRNNRVRKVSTTGVVSTIAGIGGTGFSGDGGPATAAQLGYPNGLARDGAGNLWIADSASHTVRKVAPDGTITTVAGTGTSGFSGDGGPGASAKLNTPGGLALDAAGNLFIADQNNHRIRKLAADGTISTVAGNGIGGFFGDGGPAISSSLYYPTDVKLDAAGNLYISDTSNARIRRIGTDGTISTVAGSGSCCSSDGDGGPAIAAMLSLPQGILLDAGANLYIVEGYTSRIRLVNRGGTISTVAGSGSSSFSGDGGLATSAYLYSPSYLALDVVGNLYIADSGNNRIRRLQTPASSNPLPALGSLAPSVAEAGGLAFALTVYGTNFAPGATVRWNGADRMTTFVGANQLRAAIPFSDLASAGTVAITVLNPTLGGGGGLSNSLNVTVRMPTPLALPTIVTFAGNAFRGYSGDGGAALYTSLNNPLGLVFDGLGSLYVADAGNSRVRRISSTGTVTTIAGTGVAGLSGDGGPAILAQFSAPSGLARDGAGNLFIADAGNNTVRKVAQDGTITTVAGTGTAGFSGDGGPGTSAKLNNPNGLAVDAAGNIYIADKNNHRIRKLAAADGTISTIAGNGVSGFFGDGGPAVSSPLSFPTDVKLDTAGNLYVAASGNGRIRKVGTDGIIGTVAGGGNTCCSAADGGPAINASLSSAQGILLAGAGGFYIAEGTGGRIRRVSPGGVISTVAGNGIISFSGDGGLATNATFSSTTTFMAQDAAGNIYVSDSSNNRIRRLQATALSNPVPTMNSLVPPGTSVGVASFTITVNGANFAPGAVVRWNGADRSTAFLSTNQLNATLQAADVSAAGNFPITVFNQTVGGGGGSSNPLNFTVAVPPGVPSKLIITFAGTGIGGFSGDGGLAPYTSFSSPQQLMFDSSGNLYVADSGNNRVRKISASGVVTTVAGSSVRGFAGDGGLATLAQLNGPVGVALDPAGNVYIADAGNNVIRKVTLDGKIATVAGTGTADFSGDGGSAAMAKLNSPGGLAIDTIGNLYIADKNNHRIRKLATDGTISTVAGNGVAGYFGDGGPATASPLNLPSDVKFDAAGNLYIADTSNSRIRRIGADGNIFTIAGNGSTTALVDGGPAVNTAVPNPRGIALDASGNVYLSDPVNNRIRRVDTTGVITTLAGGGTNLGDGGLATSAKFSAPSFLAMDLAGNLYVADSGNNRIRRVQAITTANPIPSLASLAPAAAAAGGPAFTLTVNGANFVPGAVVLWNGADRPTTFVNGNQVTATIPDADIVSVGSTLVTVFNPTSGGGGGVSSSLSFNIVAPPAPSTLNINAAAGTGIAGYSGDGGAASAARFSGPQGLVFDAVGNMYVADSGNHVVRKVTPAGISSTIAGTGILGFSGDGGPATSALLNRPVGLALDGAGNLYIADAGNARIRIITAGGIINTAAGSEGVGFSGDGGRATSALLNNPAGLAFDAAGNLFIADKSNNRIRRVGSDGTITTVAGNGVAGYFGDGGAAATSPLNSPADVKLDSAGNLYIADTNSNRIRRVAPDGTISTLAGTGLPALPPSPGDGGPALGATLNAPVGIALDGSGNLYFSEQSNQRIRKINAAGIITTLAGSGASGTLGDGSLATSASLNGPTYVSVSGAGDLYFSDAGNNRVRRIAGVTGLTCIYAVAASGSNFFGIGSGLGSVTVTAAGSCGWTAASNDSWITITSATSGVGNGIVAYAVSANPTQNARTGTITIAGQIFTVTQAGTSCSYSLSSAGGSYASSSQNGSVDVIATAGCAWTATSDSPWLSITSGGSGSGNATVSFSMTANPTTSQRIGNLTIAGIIYTVTQAGVACAYSLLGSGALFDAAPHTGSIGIVATAGCSWTVASDSTWLTVTSANSGTGNATVSYALASNLAASPRTGTITVTGSTGLGYVVTQSAFAPPSGFVSTGTAAGSPGGSSHVPITLTLTTGFVDSLSFGISVTPIGTAPALTGSLSYVSVAPLPTPSIVDPATNQIGVSYLNLSPALSGTVVVGHVVMNVPFTAVAGQTYALHVTGASATSGTTVVTLAPGPDAVLTVQSTYMVGDASPVPSTGGDLNADGTYNETGEFGDGWLTNFDLIALLRAVTFVPGARPPACSDRFDAMDTFPADTVATRGGDGALDNFDLLLLLRRVTTLDPSRPSRGTRGLVCTEASLASAHLAPLPAVVEDAEGSLQFGEQEGNRVPVYLVADRKLDLAGISFSVGLIENREEALNFLPAASKPSLSDSAVSGKLALSWLDGMSLAAGEKILLGYVQGGASEISLEVYGVVANAREGRRVVITFISSKNSRKMQT